PAETADGVRVCLEANLEIADEVGRVRDAGAEGIGLYRSEFLLDRGLPDTASEAAQYETYGALLEAMMPLPVTVRTVGTGGAGGRPIAIGSGFAAFASGFRRMCDSSSRCARCSAPRRAAGSASCCRS